MDQDARIYVAGHCGLVGSAIVRTLRKRGYSHIIGRSHSELDLLDAVAVRQFFDDERPEYVFLAAAYVGGILTNNTRRADFIYRNLGIQQTVIGESFRHEVKKLLFLGSTCIYPCGAPQPMSEEALLGSPLEYTNEPYAIAKIAGLKMCESFNLQYGTNYIAVMPTNLYGPNDNFDLESSHVLPAMIRKIHLSHLLCHEDYDAIRRDLLRRPLASLDTSQATITDLVAALSAFGIYPDRVELWGSGRPLREFLWSEDMAEASVFVMEQVDFRDLCPTAGLPIRNCHINIGTGQEISIADLSVLIAQTIGYAGRILFDRSKPDGTMRKLTDPSRLHRLGWRHRMDLPQGVAQLYQSYQDSIYEVVDQGGDR